MTGKRNFLGIDIGSISISIVLVSTDKEIINASYLIHNGNVRAELAKLLRKIDLKLVDGIGVTSSTPDLLKQVTRFDERVSYITTAREFYPEMGSLLIVGGEKFGIAGFDSEGNYLNYKSNSSCAAGTGSFLDQQARRLNLKNIEEFCQCALKNKGDIPKIASRCSVFAKTDLIHAQQEGYSLNAICDGLSFGLAKNIIDTLFSSTPPGSPIVFAGGVSKNGAVVQHISDLLNQPLEIHPQSHLFGAIGAALNRMEQPENSELRNYGSAEQLLCEDTTSKSYTHEPLKLNLSSYPEFNSLKRFEFKSPEHLKMPAVEIDIYKEIESDSSIDGYLGIDIGSTSTKAVLMDNREKVLAGLYTRTSGRPVEAVQVIFEATAHLFNERNCSFNFLGVGTTGSGRSFIGEIIGSDVALDEITAHARAAYQLDPEVDTIIEIGGQDSKFTTLQNGMVTFSVMNNVCAAGTGSFIEEQAKKLDCPLADYSRRAEGVSAPLTSDKCTVFMERDLNYYLSEGYSVDEALASTLHSVRDNYLTKVANEGSIGKKVFFQGATAKNKALVAAFEQKLKKPIMVSKFCHLTGALGVALHLSDVNCTETKFRGIALYDKSIPVKTEVCELCTNHCKIKTAQVEEQTVAFGFLCGRDYETQKYVKENPSGFDLLKSRKRITQFKPLSEAEEPYTIGIPAALHLFDEMDLWKKFFDQFGIKTVTSERFKHAVKEGKKLTGAEFCAPVTALHSHVNYLAEKSDYVFLPDFLEEKEKSTTGRRQYCYYTQFAPALISQIKNINAQAELLHPTLRSIRGSFYTKVQLYKMLQKICKRNIGFFKVSSAYDKAVAFHESKKRKLKELFLQEQNLADDISVVFLGRPYTVLSADMNSKIPEIFARLGIKSYFQDMLNYDADDVQAIAPLLKHIHWKFAAGIFEAAEVAANSTGLYPVLITSFKCTPDAFVIETFKQIMDARKKPYLILQLDEHDSSVGYETRIEAGIRAFRNHHSIGKNKQETTYKYTNPAFLKGTGSLKNKALILPNFDYLPCKLLEASLRKAGIETYLMEESEDSIRKSMSLNQGQCLPISMMTQAAVNCIESNNLDPAKTVIWTIDSNISCNLGVIPHSLKNMLQTYGKGMEQVEIYTGEITFIDMSLRITYNAYFAFMFGGLLKKMACKTRPYELISGKTDEVVTKALGIFYDTFLHDTSKEEAVRKVVGMFKEIKVQKTKRPQVAIFGDLYARDNDVVNQNLIGTIEKNGGEAVTTPYSEYMRMIADPFIQKWIREGLYSSAAAAKVMVKTFPMLEKKYLAVFNDILQENEHRFVDDIENTIGQFGVKLMHTGESLETLLKIFTFLHNYPEIALFVQTSPSLCCPSLVTEAMAENIEAATGIPVVNIEYDGTCGYKNDTIIPYLKYPRKRASTITAKAQ